MTVAILRVSAALKEGNRDGRRDQRENSALHLIKPFETVREDNFGDAAPA